ncbi:TPA: hypothetical protein I8303_003469 [Aeromonas hydrophila]|uniref:Uncharacterized protein n=1 Tax=Escherichia coli TaxID=562 RepID=A0A3L0W0G5_ECOLX|nr:hypothetical protein [Aeromonas sp.]HAT2714688.1 hypothetical protein [Aeromonas hydrophila]
MENVLNIATIPIADKVQRHMMASYYALQLEALQSEAKRLGYYFAQSDFAANIPPVLAERLAWATEYRRRSYLYPNIPTKWERQVRWSMEDGYAQEYLSSMLAALAALGVRLQAGPQAYDLLAAEVCCQLEKNNLPSEPGPIRDSEFGVPSLAEVLSTTQDTSKENILT